MFLPWQGLVRMTEASLATLDIAQVNLACAADLPGSVKIDAAFCLRKLDESAQVVKEFTRLCEPHFREDPGNYRNSQAYFRSLCLVTALWRHCGVHYNEAKIPLDVPLDVEDSFIHGVIQGTGGTCASLPVVLLAVGRRLGYPLKLMSAKAVSSSHLFARWNGGGECFNIDVNNSGLACPADDDYRTGMFQLDPEVERKGCFLRPKTPAEELATFLNERGHRWRHLRRRRQEANAFAWALALQMDNELLLGNVARACREWRDELRALEPPGFPKVVVTRTSESIQGLAARFLPPNYPEKFQTRPVRRFPPALPDEYERGILQLEAWENILKDPQFESQWWGSLRRGEHPSAVPTKAHVQFNDGGGCNVRLEFARPGMRV